MSYHIRSLETVSFKYVFDGVDIFFSGKGPQRSTRTKNTNVQRTPHTNTLPESVSSGVVDCRRHRSEIRLSNSNSSSNLSPSNLKESHKNSQKVINYDLKELRLRRRCDRATCVVGGELVW